MNDSSSNPSNDVIHVAEVLPRPRAFQIWERYRHAQVHWFIECVAEFMGVFFYVFAGVGSTASFVIGNLTSQPTLGSVLQVGAGYAIGIVLAISVCASTSGGHFNPAVTISFAVFKGFPWRKVPLYLFAQVLGAYVACLIIYLQWKGDITAVETILMTAGKYDTQNFTPNGPAGIFALYVTPGSNLGFVLANEFFVDIFLALTIWAALDPSNFFCPPFTVPWVIGFAYAAAIWGYSPVGLSANTARDVGGRLAALSLWGRRASGGNYAALAALTNILATLVGAGFYEFFFTDSSRVLPPAQRDFLLGHQAHMRHAENRFGTKSNVSSDMPYDEEKHVSFKPIESEKNI